MKQGPRFNVKTRRRREGNTDYRKRLALLKSEKIRIVVRNSLRNIRVQFVEYHEDGDHILTSAISKELVSKYSWKYSTSTTPAAYLTGFLAGIRASNNGISEGILDIGRQIPVKGSKSFAALKGIIDAGISCPHDSSKMPDKDRIFGSHLGDDIKSKVNEIINNITGGK
jgi:large subunit ribosomal protein L18